MVSYVKRNHLPEDMQKETENMFADLPLNCSRTGGFSVLCFYFFCFQKEIALVCFPLKTTAVCLEKR